MFKKEFFLLCFMSLLLVSCEEPKNNSKQVLKEDIQAESVQSNLISVSDATKALKNYFIQQEFPASFLEGKVVLKDEFYDVDDTLLVYYFVVEGTKTENFYLVSAVDTLDPIMESGNADGLSYHVEEKGLKKPYYVGMNNIVFADNAQDLQEKFVSSKKQTLYMMEDEKNKLQLKADQSEDEAEKLELEQQLIYIEEMIIDTSERVLEPFPKASQRSKRWDELLKYK
ncbi:hypothetical protein ACFPYN_03815 [Paenisporosarcina macmurdoensis]|uniref:Lipoprotein n=1 Tax=Paenisporosarcina macmurdoensis TaxID=212659 RepID=A0ABW1L612_9BACL